MQTLDHRYRLLGVVGEGGASVVHRALDLTTGELRAVKMLEVGRDLEATLPRLQREARALLSLRHPHILPLYGLKFSDNPYLVMELCSGNTLRTRLERSGKLPVLEVMTIGVALLGALSHAHSRGVIHRDIKPGNILLRARGIPVLADFGIAVLAADRSRTTLEGLSLGTFAFMAPEQRMDARSVDHRADIYALGATLYELATAKTAADLFMAEPTSSRWEGIPSAFVSILRRACSYRPDRRYPTARAMQIELKEAFPKEPPNAHSLRSNT